jgi:uncharacterized protein YndB with AHSA1/START domain
MAPIVSSIDIARPQNDVFAYVTDPSSFAEWQAGVEGGSQDEATSPHVGAKCMTTRRVGRTARQVTSEITKLDPPTRWGIRGIDGPIRAIVDVTVEQLNGSAQSRVTIELDFVGHGIGKLLVPLVARRQARNEMPENCRELKRRLESLPSISPMNH